MNPVDIGLKIAQALDSIGIKMGSYIGKGSNIKKAKCRNHSGRTARRGSAGNCR